MAAGDTDVGTLSTLTLGTSTYEANLEILSMEWSDIGRPDIDTTHMTSSNARTSIPGRLYSPGRLEVEAHFLTNVFPPINTVPETITLTLVVGVDNTTWAASGYFTDFSFTVPTEDKMTARFTIVFTGEITGP